MSDTPPRSRPLARDTAFIITCASTAFEDQPDRLHAIEIALFLHHWGVTIGHISLHIPHIPNVTIERPRAHPDCPRLELPSELNGVLVTNGEGMWPAVSQVIKKFNSDPDIDRIVWIYLNHGSEAGLGFPGRKVFFHHNWELSAIDCSASDLAAVLKDIVRPTIAIIDACCSGYIVADTLKILLKDAPNAPVAFLTSGRGVCHTSAVVLCDPTIVGAPLPLTMVEYSQQPSARERRVRFRVGHSMCTRGWLREVVYSDTIETFAQLPGLLNAPGRGFELEFLTNCREMEGARVRSFFPPPVQPTHKVNGYVQDKSISWGQVVLPDRLGELYDDRGDAPCVPIGDWPGFVLVDPDPGKLRDRAPRSDCIKRTGFMNDKGEIRWLALHAFKDFGRPHARPPVGVRGRVYVPLQAIAGAVIQSLKRSHRGLAFDLAVYNDASKWRRIGRAITAVNTCDRDDVVGRGLLAAWTRHLLRDEVIRVLIKVRRRIAAKFRISLRKEPPPVWPHFGPRRSKRTILRKARKLKGLRLIRLASLEKVLLKARNPVQRRKALHHRKRGRGRVPPTQSSSDVIPCDHCRTGSDAIIFRWSNQLPDPLFAPGSTVGGFIIGERLYSTAHSLIFRAASTTMGGRFVFKYIRAEVSKRQRAREIDAIRSLSDCPNAVHGFSLVEIAGSDGYFMDEYVRGDLYSGLSDWQLDEDAVRALSFRVLESLDYMHRAGFVHRDLKPEHIFLAGNRQVPLSLLAGFDRSLRRPVGRLLREYDRADRYSPPEYFRRDGYDESADMWAFGVLLIRLMARVDPFPDPKEGWGIFEAAINEEGYAQQALDAVAASGEFRDLVARLVTPRPRDRLTAKEALVHPFFAMQVGRVADESPRLTGPLDPPLDAEGFLSVADSAL